MSAAKPRLFELVPRRRFTGAPFGHRRSVRRGEGDEVAGTRTYRPGDQRAHIHWPASARLSAARGTDEFVVREFYADDAPRVAIVQDRRPAMAIHGGPAPWLDKRAAATSAVELIAASAAAELAPVVYAGGNAAAFDAPEQNVRHALEELRLSAGSFVFVVSDFLVDVPSALWLRLRARALDVVPVVVQDPTWEQSFPPVAGIVLPIRDPASGRVADLYVRGREARRRRTVNEARHAALLARFRRFGFDPVLIDAADPARIGTAFTRWADRRRQLRRSARG
jgi:uncharacterized protein (DUF58 family)